MKYISFIFVLFGPCAHAVTSDALMNVHQVTALEMNSITTPQAGSLVYNTTEDTLFFYTGSSWKKLRAEGSETIISAGNQVNTTGNGSLNTPYVIGQL